MKNKLADMYLEYVNDFLSVERFAEYYDTSISDMTVLLKLGRQFHEERCDLNKEN